MERVCSGLGLPKIYEYLSLQRPQDGNAAVAALIKSGKEDVGKVIAESAKSGKVGARRQREQIALGTSFGIIERAQATADLLFAVAPIAHDLFLSICALSSPYLCLGLVSQCPLCVQTMDLFVSCYGAEAGNLCLKTLPFGGLYIAGGIAAKNMAAMRKNQQFVNSFLDKGDNTTSMDAKRAMSWQDGQAWHGPTVHSRCCSSFLCRHPRCPSPPPSLSGRMRSVLQRVPIYLITHPQVGLLGSKVICRRILFAKGDTETQTETHAADDGSNGEPQLDLSILSMFHISYVHCPRCFSFSPCVPQPTRPSLPSSKLSPCIRLHATCKPRNFCS